MEAAGASAMSDPIPTRVAGGERPLESEILATLWLGQPVWLWLTFLATVLALLALDLGILNRGAREISVQRSLVLSSLYIGLGLAFGGFVWWWLGAQAGTDYVTGFVVEKALALDNVFVIATIFTVLAIPPAAQHRVLFWGILGVLVLRAIMIGVGAAVIAELHWVLYLFAAFLIITGIKLLLVSDSGFDVTGSPVLRWTRKLFNVTDTLHGNRFFVRLPHPATGRTALFVTPLFLALVLIEVADLIFAVDSVPAIFAITTDPFVVYTSNIFAVLGLRALYFALAAMVHRFHYLKYALALVLIFIGAKIFVADLLGLDKVPPVISLGVTLALIAGGIVWSLVQTRRAIPET